MMNTSEFAQVFAKHQKILYDGLCEDSRSLVTTLSNQPLFDELEKVRINAWNHPTMCLIVRAPNNALEFTLHRGKQHSTLHNAVTSFYAAARDAYIAHLIEKATEYNMSDDDMSTIKATMTTTPPPDMSGGLLCHKNIIFYFANRKHAFHVKLTLIVKAGNGKNYSGHFNAIAHEMPLFVKQYSDDEANETIQAMIIYHWIPYTFANLQDDSEPSGDETEKDDERNNEKDLVGSANFFPSATDEEVSRYRDSIAKDRPVMMSEDVINWLNEKFSI